MSWLEIGSWNYRNCFELDDGTCEKIKKPFSFSVSSMVNLIINWNAVEYKNYQQIPDRLKKFIPDMDLVGNSLICERVVDYDGMKSKTMSEFGSIENDNFWSEIEEIHNIIMEEEIWLLDVFRHKNIVVKRISEDTYSPRLIDIKRIWNLAFIGQLKLLTKRWKKNKINKTYTSLLRYAE